MDRFHFFLDDNLLCHHYASFNKVSALIRVATMGVMPVQHFRCSIQ